MISQMSRTPSGYGKIASGMHTNGRGNTYAQKYDLPVEGGPLLDAFLDLLKEYRQRPLPVYIQPEPVSGEIVC